jgi:hypothetical protein
MKNLSGDVIGIDGLSSFRSYSGTLTINADGTLSGMTEGPFSGRVLGLAGGTVNVSIATNEETNSHGLFINAGKDTMVMVHGAFGADHNYQELMLFQKAPANSAVADLSGFWRIATFDAPRVTEHTNPEGLLVGLSGLDGFGATRHSLISGYDGFFTGQVGNTIRGTLTLGGHGQVTANVLTPDGTETLGFHVNASHGVLVSSALSESGQELILMTHAPVRAGPFRDFGMIASRVSGGISIEWAAQTNSVLESSTNLQDWEALSDTLGTHVLVETFTPTKPKFYRVSQPVP